MSLRKGQAIASSIGYNEAIRELLSCTKRPMRASEIADFLIMDNPAWASKKRRLCIAVYRLADQRHAIRLENKKPLKFILNPEYFPDDY
jgi:hypothetical protein